MTKTFRYEKSVRPIMRPIYIDGQVDYEWDGDETETVYYTPGDEEFKNAVVEITTSYYFGDLLKKTPDMERKLKERVELLIDKNDMLDSLSEAFDKELHDYFEDRVEK